MTEIKNNFMKYSLLFLTIILPFLTFGQAIKYKVADANVKTETLFNEDSKKFIFFDGANYNLEQDDLPTKLIQLPISVNNEIGQINFKNAVYSVVDNQELISLLSAKQLPNSIDIDVSYGYFKKNKFASISFTPFRLNSQTGSVEQLVEFELDYSLLKQKETRKSKSATFSNTSVLAAGDWFKISVEKDGVFKLDANFFTSMGLDISTIDPRTIKVFGNNAGMLPALNSENLVDDLKEMAIRVEGEGDGVFNSSDFVLFYGQGPHVVYYDSLLSRFRHRLNIYSDKNYYFITYGGVLGKRVSDQISTTAPATNTVSVFDDFKFYEKEKVNLIKSGQLWLGEAYDVTNNYQFSFDFPNIDNSQQAILEASYFVRSGVSSRIDFGIGGSNFTMSLGAVNLNGYIGAFASEGRSIYSFLPSSSNIVINTSYNKPQASSKAWLNFLSINVKRRLIFSGSQYGFRSVNSVGVNEVSNFTIAGQLQNAVVWDATNPFNVKNQIFTRNGSSIQFSVETPELREFVIFEDADNGVVFEGAVENQNLHQLSNLDYVIVSHPLFTEHAEQLANFHSNDGLRVKVVSPEQIYNEFSAGSQDPVAIRSFLRMLYQKATVPANLPKYLLLYGDGSYDPKNRLSGNTNFIVTYQSPNSVSSVASFVSDDYMGLLDPNEGVFGSFDNDMVDIGVGRFPVKTLAESQSVLNKTISYNTSATFGDWRNEAIFVADDEDGTLHMNHSAIVSRNLDSIPFFNLEKLYLDAFPQVSTPGGDRYPQANVAVNAAINSGSLIVNYTGHGGETGWTAERVVGVSDINAWSNSKQLSLFITATCEFSRFDDPFRNSGGELVLLNPTGGGIALMTTTRLVYATPNLYLNDTLYKRMFEKVNGEYKRLGDVFAETKAQHSGSTNAKNFTLLGDPATRLAIPRYNVITTAINGNPVSGRDTLKALSKVTISGEVRDNNGMLMNNFNGLIYPTVFDKVKTFKTLNNDNSGQYTYRVRNSRLFKGKASVVNGQFTFQFIIPKDIVYSIGSGKISYYASDNSVDATGGTTDFLIGGTADSVDLDNEGPQIEMYLNDKQFVYGGITDENPVLILELNDPQGINTVGNGVGRDLVAYLDDETDKTFILNEYYEAELNDYSSGKVTYPFQGLSEGKHRLTIKAWDVHNNSSNKTIEFEVVKQKDIELDNVLNYPNPFTTNTQFWFEHNQAGQVLDVKVDVFTVSGKLVRSISEVVVAEGYHSRQIAWDGLDDFGDKIGRGVYVYRLKVRSRNGSVAEKYEKLVIL
tara:strand:+ start:1485 stop:5300 length:3816 start_codon:yes stop_codon:yes gene_type:complete